MLEAISLQCVRGDRELFNNLNFALGSGEMLLVSGSNGTGKTSLLRLLCGLAQPATGEVHWQGENIQDQRSEYCHSMAYLGHHNGVKEELSPLENLSFAATVAGVVAPEDKIGEVLNRVGLCGCEELPAKMLSQGQRRRIALARLLLAESRLWILDEPLAALDVQAVALVEEMLSEHLTGGGLVVLTTHQPLKISFNFEIRVG
ncbi:cytochrome c biogenesis heme-transporting ATPase CcmA [Sulfurirhabdus autotrophica]|uniref:Heme exporter protein A n=1 Tax=Sulfurirhabdus autotrophica TaxID=1706046 RepID=A0A4V2W2V4_9PROT|nr:cytochrome c biogenesis heme-transporting ATPase CcmA [Sulfurirhabdus autotrophica]TCV89509.1 heme exporter protein A [Sulfurirhabdus autotrophica]